MKCYVVISADSGVRGGIDRSRSAAVNPVINHGIFFLPEKYTSSNFVLLSYIIYTRPFYASYRRAAWLIAMECDLYSDSTWIRRSEEGEGSQLWLISQIPINTLGYQRYGEISSSPCGHFFLGSGRFPSESALYPRLGQTTLPPILLRLSILTVNLTLGSG